MQHPPVIHPNPAVPKTRKRSLALRAGVLVASGAMAAAALAVVAPIGASATNLQANLTLAAAPGSFSPSLLVSNRKPKPTPGPTPIPPSAMITGWNITSSMATARVRHAAARLADGRVLVAGGADSAGAFLSSAELYDPTSGTWHAAASMPIAMRDAAAVTLPDGRVLVAGGDQLYDPAIKNSTQLYDPATNKWTVGPQMPASGDAPAFATMLPDGNAFFLNSRPSEYNPNTNTWKVLAAAPHNGSPETGDTTLLPNGDVLTVRTIPYSDINSGVHALTGPGVYHWATDSWSTLPAAPVDPGDNSIQVATLPDGNVMLAGGVHAIGTFMPWNDGAVQEVNPTTGAWTVDATHYISGLVSLSNGTILNPGGDVYNPTTQAWTAVPGLNASSATFTTLANGTLLATGGYSYYIGPEAYGLLNQAEVYVP